MYEIYEKKTLAKVLKKLPKKVLKHYELWKRVVELEGKAGLRAVKDYDDEALKVHPAVILFPDFDLSKVA